MEPVIIGNATLYCGNCLDIMPTLGVVDHIICDPPYEEAVHSSNKTLSKGRALKDKRNPFKEFGFESIDSIRTDVVELSAQVSNGWFIAFCTLEGIAAWADSINKCDGIKYKRPCLWIKPDAMPQFNGQCPGMGAEGFVTAWAGPGASKWNAGGKLGVYTHMKNGAGERTGLHPTEKPRRLMSEIISDFTNVGQTILDPFGGVFTTGVAAVMAGRKFIGIEQNEKYFDVGCKRIEDAQRQGKLFEDAA